MTTNFDISITAMCLWEEIIPLKDSRPEIQATFERIGTCEVRDLILSFAEQCHDDWEKVADSYEESFDWDWCPTWIYNNIDWTTPRPELKPRPTPHMYLGEEAEV